MIEVPRRQWDALLEALQIDPDHVRERYQGRFMYGRDNTPAVILEDMRRIFEFMVGAGVFLDADLARELALEARVDDMLNEMLIYWPYGLEVYDE